MSTQRLLLAACAVSMALSSTAAAEKANKDDKIPITTTSPEARDLYVKGRDLAERLRFTDAHKLYEQAVAKDKDFALGWLGVAQTSGGNKDFFDALAKAVALADKVSEGEKLLILGQDAGARADAAKQRELYLQLAKLYPRDERAQNQLGLHYFNQQKWAESIEAYNKAIAIAPQFSQPYNQLGYAYRFVEKYPEAEKTFKKYIELIPDDPNPYDSYAELLMKMGRFEDSIANYQKALAIDPNFIASYIGIGNDQIFMGKSDEARKTFAKMAAQARTDGEKRTALFWTATSYVYDGDADKAVAEMAKSQAIAEAGNDLGAAAGDLNTIANIYYDAGKPDQALAKLKEWVAMADKSAMPPEVKDQAHRTFIFEEGRVAVAKGDLAGAKAKAAEYGKLVAEKKRTFEVFQTHELNGMIALAEKSWAAAAAELAQANPQDPRILYLLATAYQGKGDAGKAKATFTKVANFNALQPNYAVVRTKARAAVAKG